jgi:hypothetical protein
MFALNMMRIALELALYNNVYEEMAMKFLSIFCLLPIHWIIWGKKTSVFGMKKMNSFMMP